MTATRLKRLLIVIAALAALALPASVAAGQTVPGQAEVHEFYLHPSTTQAGAHPDVQLFFRFCDPILHVVDASNTNPIVITTAEPHGLTNLEPISVRGIFGNLAANQAGGQAQQAVVTGPNTFELHSFIFPNFIGPAIAGNGAYGGGGWVSKIGTPALHGCRQDQQNMQTRRFLLKFPPGFLGNPEVAEVCPTDKWVTSDNRRSPGEGCPFTSQVGASNTRTVTIPPASGAATMITAPTGLYRVPTNGLEPARLGTDVLVGDPPGPVPIAISLRTSGDYGLNSAVIDLPKNLGGPQAAIAEIETVLCGYAPCSFPEDPSNRNFDIPTSVTALSGARPFFVNPTACEPTVSTLSAWSWAQPGIEASANATDVDRATGQTDVPSFTPTGCENVPFDADMSVTPTETTDAGKPSAQQVAIDYCPPGRDPATTPGRCVNGQDFADDDIWQSALRDADVTLPKGMTLSPGGGVGLDACSFEQFGVAASDGSGLKYHQVNDAPPTCPEGAQIGTLNVDTPVLPDGTLHGKVFFGPVTAPGRPTPDQPWKLFLYIEGAGLRIKLVGNVDVAPDGQVHNIFVRQPQVPFNRLELNLRGGSRSILANPDDCGPHEGSATLVGWAEPGDRSFDKRTTPKPTVTTTNCPDPKPFAPQVVSAGSDPEQAGANTTSHIEITRGDGEDDIKNLSLSLPPGAVGSLAAVPKCPIGRALAGDCSEGTKVGTVKTTVGTGDSLLTTGGSLYLADPQVYGDAAALALVVPAKVGPIDLGQVVVINRVILRKSDTGVDTVTSDIPNILGGVPLHVRKIEISVDRPGFFINPTGCEPRPLVATFNSYGGQQSQSTMNLQAKGCENLSFDPQLRMIAGAKGQNAQFDHPPLTAIVTQGAGEANIKNSQVILPDLLRPNSPQFNVPGGLCTDAEFAQNACPGPSLVGSARVITPVLPFQLSGPVYVVQEIGAVLPKLYVVLRGEGLEVVIRARNSFLKAIYTVNTFEGLPDVPQAYFELKIKGGPGGILNNFYDACGVGKVHRKIDYSFTGQNGATTKHTTYLEQEGCASTSSRARATISTRSIKVNRKGVGKLRVYCSTQRRCKGKLSVNAKRGVKAAKKFSIRAKKSAAVKLKFSKKEVRKIFRKKRIKGKATAKVGSRKTGRRAIVIVRRR